jgi:predicted NUDIX family NTP pyrophosphohydrolase
VGDDVEVLLGHPGGPFWSKKDLGAWTIPKGLFDNDEPPLLAAKREFAEETGHRPDGEPLSLGEARQPGGKIVHIWAMESDWDTSGFESNSFEMKWPPRSGTIKTFPELDRVAWFDLVEARLKILKGQVPFLDRLVAVLDGPKD